MDIEVKKTIEKLIWWIPSYKLRYNIRKFIDSYEKLEGAVAAVYNYIKLDLNNKPLGDMYKKNIFSIPPYMSDYSVPFYSQHGQDIIAYAYLKAKKDNFDNGFFIEIGAFDGINLSNTYLFEKLGWNGICIEPDKVLFDKLKENRNCDCYNLAIHSKSLEKSYFIQYKNSKVFNVLKEHEDLSVNKNENLKNLESNIIEVSTITFNELMEKNYPNIRYIDFLSIDVEGGELNILETIDFNKYKFGLITIENNFENNVLANFMEKLGYVVLIDIGHDILFIKK